MRIVFVQSHNQDNGDVAIENVREMACRHALPGDFWLLPEVFDTGWNLRPGERIDGSQNIKFLRELSQEFGISVGGSFYLATDSSIRNRFYVVTSDGSEYYCDKRHPFGEFETVNVTPGDSILTFPINGILFRAIVCYDLRFPVWCRNNDGYEALICVSQWPASRQNDRTLLLAARALENVSYTLNCNGLGASMVFAPDGKLDFQMPKESDVAFYELDIERLRKYRVGHPHLKNADNFTIKY
ncbi:MAG: hypothetical protein J6U21_10885 [Bacteroidales bacterium]|nr:hypothetical protein [Bacteroidales bacterium]